MKKMRGIILAGLLLCAVMVLVCACAGAISGEGTEENPWVISTWSELQEKMTKGGYIQLGGDVTYGTGDSRLEVNNVTVYLDLNGHTINRAANEQSNGGVISVNGSNAKLTIFGEGTIKGGFYSNGNGGGIWVGNGGMLVLNSGTISGNSAFCGGGVYIGNDATFVMSGGSIKGNNAPYGGGVCVSNYGTFTMSGGTISGNTGSRGGVYVDVLGTFNISGSPVITGNKEDSSTKNVYLRSNVKITVTGKLNSDAAVGVTMYTAGVFTTGFSANNPGADPTDVFFSDDAEMYVEQDENREAKLASGTHGPHHGIPWMADSTLPNTAGSYYLTQDVSLSSKWEVPNGTTNLCLNGHTIKGYNESFIEIDNATLNLYDCRKNGSIDVSGDGIVVKHGSFNIYGGIVKSRVLLSENDSISALYNGTVDRYIQVSNKAESQFIMTGGTATNVSACGKFTLSGGTVGGVDVRQGGQFTMTGGTIGVVSVETKGEYAMSGGTVSEFVSMGTESKLTMTGGTVRRWISVHKSSEFTLSGGTVGQVNTSGTVNMSGGLITGDESYGVSVGGGTFNMSGGTISGFKSNYMRYGTVDVYGGIFIMSGGEISGNEMLKDGFGGGVCVHGNGAFEMSGGKITGNKNGFCGGGVYVENSTFKMTGGEISGNEADWGGGVMVCSGTFELSGGTISGNTTTSIGGGVCFESGTFKLSGNPVISGNKWVSGHETGLSDLALSANDRITIAGKLMNTALIGIADCQGEIVLTSGLPGNGTISSFSSDQDNMEIVIIPEGEPDAGEARLSYSANNPIISKQPAAVEMTYGETGKTVSVTVPAIDYHELSYQWYSNTTASNTKGTAITGATETVYTIPATQNAGTYYYYCEVTAMRTEGYATKTVASDAAKVTVGQKSVTITAASQEWTYDGTAHTNRTVTAPEGALLAGHTLSATTTGSVTNVADTAENNNPVAAGYQVMNGKEDVTANYNITTVAGTLTVIPADATLTANSDLTAVYNGKEQTVTGFTSEPAGLKFNNVETKGSGITVGEYSVGLANVALNETTDTTGNYVVKKVAEGTLKINPKAVTVKAKDQTIKEDGSIETGLDYAALTGALEGHALSKVTLTGDPEKGSVTPSAAVILDAAGNDVTANYEIGYEPGKLNVLGKTTWKVTFKVVNGSWDDGTSADQYAILTGYEGDTLKLAANDIPAVGSKPADTYKAGAWDTEPKADTVITEDVTYTYTYAKKDGIKAAVTFRVANGSWDDGSTEDKVVTLTGLEGDTLKLPAEKIPAVGSKPADTYKAGAWDTEPKADTVITEDVTYTYTYAKKDEIKAAVTFKVVNGAWDDGTTEDIVVTLEGYEGDTLKLPAEKIPAVGTKPAEGYEAGAWDTVPVADKEITADTAYTYTYAEKAPDPEPEPEPEPIPKGGILLPVISKVQKTAMTVSWNKIKAAEGYEVFYGPCGEDSHNAKVIRVSAKKTGCRLKNLKKKGVKSYKVWVRAYVVREGKRIPICTSLKIDSFMKGASAVFTNPKSVSLGTKQIPLAVGKTAKITASVKKEESGKRLTPHLPELRYVSSNTGIASVAEDGTVKGVGNGKCKVYVIAPNGIYKAVQVTVGVKAEELSFTEKQVKVKAGEELDLRALLKAEPKGAYLELKWESKDKKIAKVGKDGIVKGRKKGKTKITVEDKVSGLKATILVIVTD